MSIYYRVQQRINPQDPKGDKKYYLIQRSFGYIGRTKLIDDMCTNTSLTPQEASTALDYFFASIPKFLKLGYTVGLEGLGHFYTSIQSLGSDTLKEATAHKKLVTKVQFIAGKKFRDDINETPIKKFPSAKVNYRQPLTRQYFKEKGKKEKTIEMVKNCLDEGLEPELIMRLTGLTKEELDGIIKGNA